MSMDKGKDKGGAGGTPAARTGGPIEGTSRVLRELLRTPRFKASVGVLLRELDPENAGLLVRTLMWEDTGFTLSLLGAAPSLANALFFAADEFIGQASNFSPGMLAGFASGMIGQLDGRTLGHAIGRGLVLSARMAAVDDNGVAEAARGFWDGVGEGIASSLPEGAEAGEGAAGLLLDTVVPVVGAAVSRLGAEAVKEGSEARRLVAGLAAGMKAIASENPEFMRQVVVPLVEAGRQALAEAEAAQQGESEEGS